MGLFNFLEPEVFYFYVRITRYFGVARAPIHVPMHEIYDAEVVGKYSETIERYAIVERHSHLSRQHSIELYRKQLEESAIKEFSGNISVMTCLSDQSGYKHYCEKAIELEALVEARCK